MYRVSIKRKILKNVDKMPEEIKDSFEYLIQDLIDKGNIQKQWRNFCKIGENRYHCHLAYSWVACWKCEKKSIYIEVYYAGSREKAPY